MKKWKMILPIVVVISFLLSCVSVNAQVNNGNNENDWFAQHKLSINIHENKTFSSNGVDKAKMSIEIRNKTTDRLVEAPFNISIVLRSSIGNVKPREVILVMNGLQSEEILVNSTQPGNASIKAEAANFDVAAYASVEFKPQPDPCELLLTALPNENILADRVHSTTLTVKLLDTNDEPIKPLEDRYIDIGTKGGSMPKIIIGKGKLYGQMNFTTYKGGNHTITAKSHDFTLEDSTVVTFISPITLLTAIFAMIGGLLAGIVKYYYKHYEKDFVGSPKQQNDGTWRLGMLGHGIFHIFFGFIIYVGACVNMPFTNLFKLPIDIWYGVLMIGLTGGLFFFAIIYSWGLLYKGVIKRTPRG
jgi:hypothetical protein